MQKRRSTRFMASSRPGQGIIAYVGAMAIASSLVTTLAFLGHHGMEHLMAQATSSVQSYFVSEATGVENNGNPDVHYRHDAHHVFSAQ